MASTTRKESYEELTEKQKQIMQAAAEGKGVVEIEEEGIANNGYASVVINKHEHILEQLKQPPGPIEEFEATTEEPGSKANANGEERVVVESAGNTYEGEPLDLTWQYLSERDVDPDLEHVHAEGRTISVCFEFGRGDTESVLADEEAPAELRERLVDVLLDEVF